MMMNETNELIQELNGLRAEMTRNLGSMLRDLESSRIAFGSAMKMQTGVPIIPTPQVYVLEYKDKSGSRIAVVRTVVRHTETRFIMYTVRGEAIQIDADQISGWEPVLQRDPEPFPDGWWR